MIGPMTAARAATLGTLRQHMGEAAFEDLKNRLGVSGVNRMADAVLDAATQAFLVRLMRDPIPGDEPEVRAYGAERP